MSRPDTPYTFAVGTITPDAEYRERLRNAYAAKFAAMDAESCRALLMEVAEALDSLGSTFSGDPRDFAAYKRDAWAYGIVCGWGDGEAMREVAAAHGWDDDLVTRLRRYEDAVERLTKHSYLRSEHRRSER